MKRDRLLMTVLGLAIVAAGGLWAAKALWAGGCGMDMPATTGTAGGCGMDMPATNSTASGSHEHAAATPAADVDAALAAVDTAAKALQAGDKAAAQAALDTARKLLLAMKTAAGAPAQAVNTRCPIMGGAIDPAKLTTSLTRVFQGKTIAFCCGSCPVAWDKLTDAQKEVKWRAVTPASH